MKDKWIRYKSRINILLLAVLILTGAFLWGGNYPKVQESEAQVKFEKSEIKNVETTSPEEKEENTENVKKQVSKAEVSTSSEKDQYKTSPVPEGKPTPVEPQNAAVTEKKGSCTLSISCKTLLDNKELLDKEKWELVPKDGVIFAEKTVTFYEGESVFNVLQREAKKAEIQIEFSNTPIYNSAYIEGINNLYEFDAGELSGWVYEVNGWFPNYGCSRYLLQDGDVVRWHFTCDLGKDVGGTNVNGS